MKYRAQIMGMSCNHCDNVVKKILANHSELKNVIVSHKSGILEYSSSENQIQLLKKIFKDSEYSVRKYNKYPVVDYAIYLLIIMLFLFLSKGIYNKFDVSSFSDSFAIAGIFIFGIITSFHCVGMCGGIALSQSDYKSKNITLKNTILYNSGRILTYGFIGGVLGSLGVVFTFSDALKPILFFVIGTVMLLLGFNNLGLIKFNLKKLNIKMPNQLEGKSSFLVGIMNGFMPCGPLQTVQLLALSSASYFKGILIMIAFGLGTVPLLFIFSNLGSLLKKSHHQQLVKISAIVVIAMSIMIFNQGFNSLGVTLIAEETTGQPFAQIEDGFQIVNLTVNPYYITEDVKVKKDILVKLIINVESVSGCTDTITVPRYDLSMGLSPGIQELIFTPNKAETLRITCWMSMVNTSLNVVD